MKIKFILKKIESVFIVLSLMLFSGAFVAVIRRESGIESDIVAGDPLLRTIYFGIYIIAFCFALMRLKRFLYVAFSDKLLLSLVALTMLSSLWSAVPGLTLRRSVGLLGTTMFGIYLAARYTLDEQLRLLIWAFGILVISSLIFAVWLPDYGVMHVWGKLDGNWQGVFPHKNTLGLVVALATILFLHFISQVRKHHWVVWSCVILSIVVLFFSRALGASVTLIMLVLLFPFYRTLKWSHRLTGVIYSFVLLLLGLVGIVILNDLDAFFAMLGREVTLTGRVPLWGSLFKMIAQRPWLGYGYNGFWLGEDSSLTRMVWRLAGWDPNHAHNGFLGLWLDLGSLGFAIFSLSFLLAFVRAVKYSKSVELGEKFWLLTYLMYMFFTNQLETTILKPNSIYWLIYVSVVFSLAVKYPIKQIVIRPECDVYGAEIRDKLELTESV